MTQNFQIPFSSSQLNAAVGTRIQEKMDVMIAQSISYVYSGMYWIEVRDYNNNIVTFIRPNSSGDINFPEPITQYVLLVRNTDLPPEDLGITNPTLYIRFNGVESTITTITSNVSSTTGATVIITNVPHVIVDSGNIDVDSVAGDVDVVNGSTPFHVEVDNLPATQDVDIVASIDLPVVNGATPLDVQVSNFPATQDVDITASIDLPVVNGATKLQTSPLGFDFLNETTNTTANVFAGAGVLHGMQINVIGVGSSVTITEITSGAVLAVIDTATMQLFFTFDARTSTGFQYTTAGGTPADITFLYIQ